MKKLPNIYKNEINKNIKNNKTVCHLSESREPIQKDNIQEILNKIFNGLGYSYNIPVIIETINKNYQTSLIARTNNNIITLDNEVIPIADIKKITIK